VSEWLELKGKGYVVKLKFPGVVAVVITDSLYYYGSVNCQLNSTSLLLTMSVSAISHSLTR